ncbi:hypothetical protein EMIHUDRAFT_447442 [Emiliania huxleyi CCMP1516]|uniref:J domain-containing protein n=2 Tax=Emiliania huxleyi TaxID=2903 RepID=A0A0D3L126_EMIH1|nr:hypothetical protein EMIHUDRAFT_447442 [Emiliania huxleyi CCMP1516]EOD41711.1 hypothetical protein EMIHUDRAFT_447442 [Emiliania huxleyi CCMP1516]|eukprot:XP_005794140.1 hypothetical protein EMIHUDRAFT_447442 [Emiliania huxleyi CCMP1516]
MLSGEALAAAVLEAKDRYALLSLGRREGGEPIRVESDGYLNHEDEEVRKCYTRIAARIHPDKLRCAEATKAFQALVRAYELCCKPDPKPPTPKPPKHKPSRPKAKAKSKEATGGKGGAEAQRTGVKRPPPHRGQGGHVHCLRCLLDFGCLTAEHHCPYCERGFEYRPAQFRTALRCPNDKRRGVPDCGRAFRVRQFAMSRQTREALLARAKEEAAAAERRDAVTSGHEAHLRAGAKQQASARQSAKRPVKKAPPKQAPPKQAPPKQSSAAVKGAAKPAAKRAAAKGGKQATKKKKKNARRAADSSDGDYEADSSPERLPSKARAKASASGRPSRGGRIGGRKSYVESDGDHSDSWS